MGQATEPPESAEESGAMYQFVPRGPAGGSVPRDGLSGRFCREPPGDTGSLG
jgi:hypothetical protein